jgi:hypothetical protein
MGKTSTGTPRLHYQKTVSAFCHTKQVSITLPADPIAWIPLFHLSKSKYIKGEIDVIVKIYLQLEQTLWKLEQLNALGISKLRHL